MKENTCFKRPPKCYNLFLTNYKYISTYNRVHKMTVTILKSEYIKADPIQIQYRNYKNFNPILFRGELRNNLDMI